MAFDPKWDYAHNVQPRDRIDPGTINSVYIPDRYSQPNPYALVQPRYQVNRPYLVSPRQTDQESRYLVQPRVSNRPYLTPRSGDGGISIPSLSTPEIGFDPFAGSNIVAKVNKSVATHIYRNWGLLLSGFVQGFTTLAIGNLQPQNLIETLNYQIGNLMGFLGIVPFVGAPGQLIAKGIVKGTKGALQLAKFTTGFGTALAKQTGVELAEVTSKKVGSRLAARPGKIVPGFAEFTSVPRYIGEIATRAVSKGLSTSVVAGQIARGPAWIAAATAEGSITRHIAHQAFSLGTAFSVGSWQEGADAMLQSFALGAAFGGFDRILVNVGPIRRIVREGHFQEIPRIRDLSLLWKGQTPAVRNEASKMFARSLAGGFFNMSVGQGLGQPSELWWYDFLLGSYFGAREINAGQQRALKIINQYRHVPYGHEILQRTHKELADTLPAPKEVAKPAEPEEQVLEAAKPAGETAEPAKEAEQGDLFKEAKPEEAKPEEAKPEETKAEEAKTEETAEKPEEEVERPEAPWSEDTKLEVLNWINQQKTETALSVWQKKMAHQDMDIDEFNAEVDKGVFTEELQNEILKGGLLTKKELDEHIAKNGAVIDQQYVEEWAKDKTFQFAQELDRAEQDKKIAEHEAELKNTAQKRRTYGLLNRIKAERDQNENSESYRSALEEEILSRENERARLEAATTKATDPELQKELREEYDTLGEEIGVLQAEIDELNIVKGRLEDHPEDIGKEIDDAVESAGESMANETRPARPETELQKDSRERAGRLLTMSDEEFNHLLSTLTQDELAALQAELANDIGDQIGKKHKGRLGELKSVISAIARVTSFGTRSQDRHPLSLFKSRRNTLQSHVNKLQALAKELAPRGKTKVFYNALIRLTQLAQHQGLRKKGFIYEMLNPDLTADEFRKILDTRSAKDIVNTLEILNLNALGPEPFLRALEQTVRVAYRDHQEALAEFKSNAESIDNLNKELERRAKNETLTAEDKRGIKKRIKEIADKQHAVGERVKRTKAFERTAEATLRKELDSVLKDDKRATVFRKYRERYMLLSGKARGEKRRQHVSKAESRDANKRHSVVIELSEDPAGWDQLIRTLSDTNFPKTASRLFETIKSAIKQIGNRIGRETAKLKKGVTITVNGKDREAKWESLRSLNAELKKEKAALTRFRRAKTEEKKVEIIKKDLEDKAPRTLEQYENLLKNRISKVEQRIVNTKIIENVFGITKLRRQQVKLRRMRDVLSTESNIRSKREKSANPFVDATVRKAAQATAGADHPDAEVKVPIEMIAREGLRAIHEALRTKNPINTQESESEFINRVVEQAEAQAEVDADELQVTVAQLQGVMEEYVFQMTNSNMNHRNIVKLLSHLLQDTPEMVIFRRNIIDQLYKNNAELDKPVATKEFNRRMAKAMVEVTGYFWEGINDGRKQFNSYVAEKLKTDKQKPDPENAEKQLVRFLPSGKEKRQMFEDFLKGVVDKIEEVSGFRIRLNRFVRGKLRRVYDTEAFKQQTQTLVAEIHKKKDAEGEKKEPSDWRKLFRRVRSSRNVSATVKKLIDAAAKLSKSTKEKPIQLEFTFKTRDGADYVKAPPKQMIFEDALAIIGQRMKIKLTNEDRKILREFIKNLRQLRRIEEKQKELEILIKRQEDPNKFDYEKEITNLINAVEQDTVLFDIVRLAVSESGRTRTEIAEEMGLNIEGLASEHPIRKAILEQYDLEKGSPEAIAVELEKLVERYSRPWTEGEKLHVVTSVYIEKRKEITNRYKNNEGFKEAVDKVKKLRGYIKELDALRGKRGKPLKGWEKPVELIWRRFKAADIWPKVDVGGKATDFYVLYDFLKKLEFIHDSQLEVYRTQRAYEFTEARIAYDTIIAEEGLEQAYFEYMGRLRERQAAKKLAVLRYDAEKAKEAKEAQEQAEREAESLSEDELLTQTLQELAEDTTRKSLGLAPRKPRTPKEVEEEAKKEVKKIEKKKEEEKEEKPKPRRLTELTEKQKKERRAYFKEKGKWRLGIRTRKKDSDKKEKEEIKTHRVIDEKTLSGLKVLSAQISRLTQAYKDTIEGVVQSFGEENKVWFFQNDLLNSKDNPEIMLFAQDVWDNLVVETHPDSGTLYYATSGKPHRPANVFEERFPELFPETAPDIYPNPELPVEIGEGEIPMFYLTLTPEKPEPAPGVAELSIMQDEGVFDRDVSQPVEAEGGPYPHVLHSIRNFENHMAIPADIYGQVSIEGVIMNLIWRKFQENNTISSLGLPGVGIIRGAIDIERHSNGNIKSTTLVPLFADLGTDLNKVHARIRSLQMELHNSGYILMHGVSDKEYFLYIENPFKSINQAENYILESLMPFKDMFKKKGEKRLRSILAKILSEQHTRRINEELYTSSDRYEMEIFSFAAKMEYVAMMNNMPIKKLLKNHLGLLKQQGDFLKNALKANKRVQITFQRQLSIASMQLNQIKTLEDSARENEEFQILILNDAKGERGPETDGDIILRDDIFDAIAEQYGFNQKKDSKIGAIKPFITHITDPSLGALLGKASFQRGEPEHQRWMHEQGIHMIGYESSVKQRGYRKLYDLDIKRGKILGVKGEDPMETYAIPLEAITINTAIYDDTSKIGKPVDVPVQFYSWLYREDKKGLDAFEEALFGEGSLWRGKPEANDKVEAILEAFTEGSDSWQALENQLIQDLNIADVGIEHRLAVIYGMQVSHSQLYNRVIMDIMKWQDNEGTELDFNDQPIDDPSVAALSNIARNRRVDRFWMDLGTSTGLHIADITSKPFNQYFHKVLASYVQRHLYKPKWEFGMKTILSHSDEIRGRLKAGEVKLGRGAYSMKVKWGKDGNEKITLKEAWDIFEEAGGWKKAPKWMKKYMHVVSMRVPSPSLSGNRLLKFMGFLDVDGGVAQYHWMDMGYMGGADLDIDSAYIFQGLPQAFMDSVNKARHEFHKEVDGKLVYIPEKNPEDRENYVVDEEASWATDLFSLFDAESFLKTNYSSAAGKKLLEESQGTHKRITPYYNYVLEPRGYLAGNRNRFGSRTRERILVEREKAIFNAMSKDEQAAARLTGKFKLIDKDVGHIEDTRLSDAVKKNIIAILKHEGIKVDEKSDMFWSVRIKTGQMDVLKKHIREMLNYSADSSNYSQLITIDQFSTLMAEAIFDYSTFGVTIVDSKGHSHDLQYYRRLLSEPARKLMYKHINQSIITKTWSQSDPGMQAAEVGVGRLKRTDVKRYPIQNKQRKKGEKPPPPVIERIKLDLHWLAKWAHRKAKHTPKDYTAMSIRNQRRLTNLKMPVLGMLRSHRMVTKRTYDTHFFKDDVYASRVPKAAGAWVFEVFDLFDQYVGTGRKTLGQYEHFHRDIIQLFVTDTQFQDDFLSAIGRLRVNVMTAKPRKKRGDDFFDEYMEKRKGPDYVKTGREKLSKRYEPTREEIWAKQYKDDPEYVLQKAEQRDIDFYWNDLADITTASMLYGEFQRIKDINDPEFNKYLDETFPNATRRNQIAAYLQLQAYEVRNIDAIIKHAKAHSESTNPSSIEPLNPKIRVDYETLDSVVETVQRGDQEISVQTDSPRIRTVYFESEAIDYWNQLDRKGLVNFADIKRAHDNFARDLITQGLREGYEGTTEVSEQMVDAIRRYQQVYYLGSLNPQRTHIDSAMNQLRSRARNLEEIIYMKQNWNKKVKRTSTGKRILDPKTAATLKKYHKELRIVRQKLHEMKDRWYETGFNVYHLDHLRRVPGVVIEFQKTLRKWWSATEHFLNEEDVQKLARGYALGEDGAVYVKNTDAGTNSFNDPVNRNVGRILRNENARHVSAQMDRKGRRSKKAEEVRRALTMYNLREAEEYLGHILKDLENGKFLGESIHNFSIDDLNEIAFAIADNLEGLIPQSVINSIKESAATQYNNNIRNSELSVRDAAEGQDVADVDGIIQEMLPRGVSLPDKSAEPVVEVSKTEIGSKTETTLESIRKALMDNEQDQSKASQKRLENLLEVLDKQDGDYGTIENEIQVERDRALEHQISLRKQQNKLLDDIEAEGQRQQKITAWKQHMQDLAKNRQQAKEAFLQDNPDHWTVYLKLREFLRNNPDYGKMFEEKLLGTISRMKASFGDTTVPDLENLRPQDIWSVLRVWNDMVSTELRVQLPKMRKIDWWLLPDHMDKRFRNYDVEWVKKKVWALRRNPEEIEVLEPLSAMGELTSSFRVMDRSGDASIYKMGMFWKNQIKEINDAITEAYPKEGSRFKRLWRRTIDPVNLMWRIAWQQRLINYWAAEKKKVQAFLKAGTRNETILSKTDVDWSTIRIKITEKHLAEAEELVKKTTGVEKEEAEVKRNVLANELNNLKATHKLLVKAKSLEDRITKLDKKIKESEENNKLVDYLAKIKEKEKAEKPGEKVEEIRKTKIPEEEITSLKEQQERLKEELKPLVESLSPKIEPYREEGLPAKTEATKEFEAAKKKEKDPKTGKRKGRAEREVSRLLTDKEVESLERILKMMDKQREKFIKEARRLRAQAKEIDHGKKIYKLKYQDKETKEESVRELTGYELLKYMDIKMTKYFMYQWGPNKGKRLLGEGYKDGDIIDVRKFIENINKEIDKTSLYPNIGINIIRAVNKSATIQNTLVNIEKWDRANVFKERLGITKKYGDIKVQDIDNDLLREYVYSMIHRYTPNPSLQDDIDPATFFPFHGHSESDAREALRNIVKNEHKYRWTEHSKRNDRDYPVYAADFVRQQFNRLHGYAEENHWVQVMHDPYQSWDPFFGNKVALLLRPMAGFETGQNLMPNFFEQTIRGQIKSIASIIGYSKITDFEQRQRRVNEKIKGKDEKEFHRKRSAAWANYFRVYASQALGRPSVLPAIWMGNDEFNIGPFAKALTDTRYVRKAHNETMIGDEKNVSASVLIHGLETLKDVQRLRMFSEVEARYELLSLLAHPKIWYGNVTGGTVNSIVRGGLTNWIHAGNYKWLKANISPEFDSYESVLNYSRRYGLSRAELTQELSNRFETQHLSLRDAIVERLEMREDGTLTGQDIIEIALQNRVVAKTVEAAAFFIQNSEDILRTRAWMTGYILARQIMNFQSGVHDDLHPFLINFANKFVAGTQFIYSNTERPIALSTNLGKIFGRFKLWMIKSAVFPFKLVEEYKRVGYDPNSYEHQAINRYLTAILFMTVLGEYFGFSIFSSALPAPADQMVNLAHMFFSEEKDDSSFYGYGRFGVPGAVYSQIRMPVTRIPDALFTGMLTGEWRRLADYHLWNALPFGRSAKSIINAARHPENVVKEFTGIPLTPDDMLDFVEQSFEKNRPERVGSWN